MRKTLVLAILVAATTACPRHWSELKRSESPRRFVLEKDYTRSEERGLMKVTWVEGLRAGTYTLHAEDEAGFYFLGSGACVIRLTDDDAAEYLKTGGVKSLRQNLGGTNGFLPGGLWLPRPGGAEEPQLFYIFGGDVNEEGLRAVSTAGGQPQTVPQGVGAGIGAGTVGAIIASGKGEVHKVPFAEKGFIAGLKIVEK